MYNWHIESIGLFVLHALTHVGAARAIALVTDVLGILPWADLSLWPEFMTLGSRFELFWLCNWNVFLLKLLSLRLNWFLRNLMSFGVFQ